MHYTAKKTASLSLIAMLASFAAGCGGGADSSASTASEVIATTSASSVPNTATKSVAATQAEADALADIAIAQAKALATNNGNVSNISGAASGAPTTQGSGISTKSVTNLSSNVDALVSKEANSFFASGAANTDAIVNKAEQITNLTTVCAQAGVLAAAKLSSCSGSISVSTSFAAGASAVAAGAYATITLSKVTATHTNGAVDYSDGSMRMDFLSAATLTPANGTIRFTSNNFVASSTTDTTTRKPLTIDFTAELANGKIKSLLNNKENSKAFNLDIVAGGSATSIIRNADVRAPYAGGHIDLQYTNATVGNLVSVPFNANVTAAGNTSASVNLTTVKPDGSLGGTVSISVGGVTRKFDVSRASF